MNRLSKSSNKVISGVLGGIAEYFGVNAIWLRIGFVLLAFIPGVFFTLLIIYIIASIIMPESDGFTGHESATRGSRRGLLWLGVIFVLGGVFFLLNELLPIDLMHYVRYFVAVSKEYIVAIILILLGMFLIYRSSNRKETVIVREEVAPDDIIIEEAVEESTEEVDK